MNTIQHPVIIIGGGSANGLGIARTLGSLGIPIYCVTSNPQELTLYSRYCTRGALIPGIEGDSRILFSFLTQLRRQLPQTGVLFPTTDTALLTVAAIRNALDHYVTFLPDPDIVTTMVIKSRFYQTLRAHQVPHPVTLLPSDPAWETQLLNVRFPIYIRPAQSLQFYEYFQAKGFIAQNSIDLFKYLQIAKQHQISVMLQEIIPGPTQHGVTLRGYMDQQGRVLALMATQKIRQPALFSNVTVNRTVPLKSPRVRALKGILLPFLRTIRYRGLFGAEFKHDSRDGIPKLLEINARSMGGNYFATQCGLNDIFIAYCDALQKDVTPSQHYDLGVYKIHLIHDLQLLLRFALKRRVTYHDLYPYFRHKVMQIYVHHDPLPFLAALRHTLTLRNLRTSILRTNRRVSDPRGAY